MSSRSINAAGLALLEEFEQGPLGGPALRAYLCPAGVWTIGWGHTKGVSKGDTCTLAQAEQWLSEDIAWAEDEVSRMVTVPLSDNQFAALVCFTFNCGRSALDHSTLLAEVDAGDIADVPAQLRRWNKVKGQTSLGLTRRREAEVTLWNTPGKES